MQTRLEDFEKQDAVVLAISADPPDKSAEIVEAYHLAFPVLSDPETEAIHAYGVVHEMGDPIRESDIARPATFLIDRRGRVAWRHLPKNWRVRPRPQELLDELAKIP